MSDDEISIIQIFLEEAEDTVLQFEAAVLEMEAHFTIECCDTLFRSAHNLKGSSKSVGLPEFGDFVHNVENVISQLKNEILQPSEDIIRAFLDAQSIMQQWLEGLAADEVFFPEEEVISLVARLKEFLVVEGEEPVKEVAPVVEESDEPEITEADLQAALDGNFPDESPPSSEESNVGNILLQDGSISEGDLENAVAIQERKLGEILVDENVTTPAKVESALQKQKSIRKAAPADRSIRISANKLDVLMQLTGELSTHQAIIWHCFQNGQLDNKQFKDAIFLCHKIVKEVQEKGLALRMQPVERLFQRLERIAKDVSRGQGKKIKVHTEGRHTELDKTILEKVTDPLVHVMRNAVDHGIEKNTEDRLAAEKSEIAVITMRASTEAGGVIIELSDDGRGMDPDKLFAKAVEKGVVNPKSKMAPEDILQLILAPGFSTAEQVTDVSGRGVGMDVVKQVIDEVGGTLKINSKLGVGTSFTLNLPTSMSIIEAIIISVQGLPYAVPVNQISEVLHLVNYEITSSSKNKGNMISLRDEVVPVESLVKYIPVSEVDNVFAQSHISHGKNRPAILSRLDERLYAFEIDDILGQQSIVVKELRGKLAENRVFSGGTILASGEPGIIINLVEVVRQYRQKLGGGRLDKGA